MVSDAELTRLAEQYLESECSAPEIGMPFHRFLAIEGARPTHSSHREEKGGSLFARVAIAIRRAAGRTWLR